MNCDQVSTKSNEINTALKQESVFPKEIWATCAKYLDMRDIANLSKVNKYFAKRVQETRFFILTLDIEERQKQIIDKLNPILANILPNHLHTVISKIGDDIINKKNKRFFNNKINNAG